MVAGDKNMDERNGRRSRGPSPNGHLSDDSSASDDSDHDGGMRVGEDYQVHVPSFNPGTQSDAKAEAMLVWAPHPELPEPKLDEYVHVAKEKHGYNVEQALGMLFWHKHSIEKALTDLANFTPFPDEWTVEDKVLFEQAFSFHGKSFHRIRQMLPDKSIASLVKYYYSWKKTRSRTSLMDRQARKLTNNRDDSDDDMDGSGNSDSDFESIKENGKEEVKPVSRPGPACKKTDGGHLRMKNKRKPPRGMYLNYDDLIAIATGPPGQGEALLKQLDTELVSLKRQVQNNKQLLSMHKKGTSQGIDSLRPGVGPMKINHKWTSEELLLAVQGVRKYGKNFKAIAEVIGNKTEAHIRSFFVNYRRRYNLDEVLSEYEKEHGSSQEGAAFSVDEEEEMEVDPKEETGSTTNGDTNSPHLGGGDNSQVSQGEGVAKASGPTPLPLLKTGSTPSTASKQPSSLPASTKSSHKTVAAPPPLLRPTPNPAPTPPVGSNGPVA